MLADVIRGAAHRFGDAVFTDAPDGSVGFAELDRRSDDLAAAFYAEGVRPGDRIALRLASGVGYLTAYVAAAKLGAVTAGVNTGLSPVEQERLVALSDPALVIDGAEQVDELCARGVALPRARGVPDDVDRPVALVFTSGSTGQPRAAMFGTRQLAAVTTLDTGGEWADRAGTPVLASTHFAHIGFMTKLPWYAQRGLRLLVLPRWRADDVLTLVAEHRIAEIGTVAPQVALMLASPLIDRLDLSCVRRVVAGGAASPPALVIEARRRFGADYVVRYSSTESGGCGLGTSPDDPDEALRSVGRPRPGVDAEVRDGDGRSLPDGETGELWLRTPTAMTGYWRDEAATREALVDGWLRTGDLAARNGDGTFTLSGRLKEMYIRGGYNVYPAEVETVLSTHPQVRECVVVPRPHATMGEVGVAVVTLREPATGLSSAEVREFLTGRIASWKVPEDVVVVDELPRGSTHKLDRRAAAALVPEGRATSGGGEGTAAGA